MRGGDQGLRSDDEQKRVCENTDRGRLKTIVLRCLSLVLSLEMFIFFFFFFMTVMHSEQRAKSNNT